MAQGKVSIPNGFIINLYKYLDISTDDHEKMEEFYEEKRIDFCRIFQKRELAYGHYDRIQFCPIMQFGDYTEKTSQAYNWMGTSQSTLIFPLETNIKERAFGWEGTLEKPSIRIRVGDDEFERGKGFLAASFCYISDEARNRFKRYDELLIYCKEAIMDLIKAFNEEEKMTGESGANIIAEVFGSFSSAEIVIVWSAKQYVDILYLVDSVKDIRAINSANNKDLVNIFRSTYTTISYPDNLTEYPEATTKVLFEDAKDIRGDALIEIGIQENTNEDYINRAEKHFADSLSYVSQMFGEEEKPIYEMFICAGEYDLIFKTKSKYVSRIFHKLHANDKKNSGKNMNIHNLEFHKFFLHTSTRLCYTIEDLPTFVSNLNWEVKRKSICNRTVEFSSRYFDRNWRSNLISNLWNRNRKRFDQLQAKIRTCFPAVSSFSVVLDQLFSDYVQCASTAADYIWIMDYNVFIEKVLFILQFYIDEHFMKGAGIRKLHSVGVIPQLKYVYPMEKSTCLSHDILQEMTRLVESVEQQTIHISASNKLFFKEQSNHFGYTAQYDLLIHAYYGMIKELMEEIYRHEEYEGLQSSLYPLINFRPVHSIESEMFVETKGPSKYDEERIVVFRLPLDAMNNILHYAPMLIHEVYHYAAPANRKGRNEYLSLIAAYRLIVASICRLFYQTAENIVGAELSAGKTVQKQPSEKVSESSLVGDAYFEYDDIDALCSTYNTYFISIIQETIKNLIEDNKEAIFKDILKYELEEGDKVLRTWHVSSIHNWMFQPIETTEDDGNPEKQELCSYEHLIELSILKVKEILAGKGEKKIVKFASQEEHEMFSRIAKIFLEKAGGAGEIPIEFMQKVLEASDRSYNDVIDDIFYQLDELLPDCAMVSLSGMTISGYLLQVAINHDANFYEIEELMPSDILRYGLIMDWITLKEKADPIENTLAEELEKFKKRYLAVYQIQNKNHIFDASVIMDKAGRWCEYFYSCVNKYKIKHGTIIPWLMELLRKHIMPVLEKPSNQFKDVYIGYLQVLDAKENDRQNVLFSQNLKTILRFQTQKLITEINSRQNDKVQMEPTTLEVLKMSTDQQFTFRIKEFTEMYYVLDWLLNKLTEYRRIDHCADHTGMWFRGVGNSKFSILPSGLVHFAENCEHFHGKCRIDEDTYLSSQRHLYENFRYTADSSPEHHNPSFYTTVDHLALMQHYQTHSNLLDWSEDIDTALYFALEDEVNVNEKFCDKLDSKNYQYGDKDGVVLILDPVRLNKACREMEKEYAFLDPYEKDDLDHFEQIPNLSVLGTLQYYQEFSDLHQLTVKKEWIKSEKGADEWSFDKMDLSLGDTIHARLPRAVYTSKINPRLKAQSGMFVAFSLLSRPMYPLDKSEVDPSHRIKLFEYESLDVLQKLYLKDNIASGSSIKNRNPFLYKIIIPKELKKVFGQRLHRLGFSKEKFYPEIQNHHSR